VCVYREKKRSIRHGLLTWLLMKIATVVKSCSYAYFLHPSFLLHPWHFPFVGLRKQKKREAKDLDLGTA
jgi:hypothetical protein